MNKFSFVQDKNFFDVIASAAKQSITDFCSKIGLDCFAALAMTDIEFFILYRGIPLQKIKPNISLFLSLYNLKIFNRVLW